MFGDRAKRADRVFEDQKTFGARLPAMTATPTRRAFLASTSLAAGATVLGVPPAMAADGTSGPPQATKHSADLALAWIDAAYELVRRENLSPPAAARLYAFVAVAMHEAVVAGTPDGHSLAGRLTGLTETPRPRHRGQIDWPTALSGAVAGVLEALLPFRAETSRALLADTLDAALAARRAAGATGRVAMASLDHGRSVANHLVRWAGADGYAEIAGRPFTPPTGSAHYWESTPPNFRPAVEPHWSQVRPMVLRAADEVEPEPHVPFDPDPDSDFGRQALAPYRQSFVNTAEQKAIASFWTDNPGSFTPPFGTATGLPAGHWMLICSIALRQSAANLAEAAAAYAMVGVTLHDAFLNCWTWKYRYVLLRPITYVRRYIDPAWSTFINTPQFPEYTSGHSVASPAAAAVLTALFGAVAYRDDTGMSRGLPARSFASFEDAAAEAAQSRLYGGIHYPMAISAGFDQGRQIGALVLDRLIMRR